MKSRRVKSCHLSLRNWLNSFISASSFLFLFDAVTYHHLYDVVHKLWMHVMHTQDHINFNCFLNKAYLNYQIHLLIKYVTVYFLLQKITAKSVFPYVIDTITLLEIFSHNESEINFVFR
jgi:hypothetical protein